MQIASLRKEHASPLLELWNEAATYDPVTAQVFHEKIWGDADFDEELTLVAIEADVPVAFAQSVVRQHDSVPRGYVKLVAVAPQHQRQGIGRRLLEQLHNKMIEQGVKELRVAESAPNYLTPGVDARYEDALFFFQSIGYQRIGEAKNLIVQFAGHDFSTVTSEQELVNQEITICRATAKVKPLLDDFLHSFWPSWKAEVGKSMACDPPAVHLALADRTVVGFSAYDGNNQGTGWFGPMGTHPDYRGHGIGKVLSARCLHDLQAQGLSEAIIPWVSETSLYESQLGAVLDRTFVRMEWQLN